MVNCPPPKITTKDKVGFFHLRKVSCVPHISKNFTDADMMRSLSCFLQWVVYSSTPLNDTLLKSIPILTPLSYLQNALVKGKKGGNASVSFTNALDERLGMTIKRALDTSEGIQMVHEYIVSLYGTNALRHLCPNFCYTFAMYQSPTKIVRLAMETIPGPRIIDEVLAQGRAEFSQGSMMEFMKLWVQIVLALELAQETLFFTHFDLHGENVLLRPIDPPLPFLDYPILDTIYRIENVAQIATLIDFEHSTIRYDKGFVGQVKEGFPQYGMYPFYVPGADLFKLLAYLWQTLYDKKYAATSMGFRLVRFFQFCLDKFYNVQTVDPSQPNYKSIAQLRNTYNNGTELPSAFFSPYDMLRFLESRKTEIFNILGITSYPWTTRAISPSFTLYSTLRYRKKETYQCYQDLFCSPIEGVPRNLYHFTTQDTNPGITQGHVEAIFAKKIPLLQKSLLSAMDAFLEPQDLWTLFNRYVEFKCTEMRKKRQPFSQNMTPYFYYYRAYVCILGYKSFFSPPPIK
jgi:hypothetical protein